ncbi:uncharacterized protein Z518_08217 [Rhinocladiella mackenziei CBS 650.93]|uniref:Major facilitator superfamily (MFS) profile domain-containing protein n=1 Tax=Rhinocladiella mackenziei CBS 650.93 TaxID=1442369 RepID=A0A0D2GVH6_9EURO|nr:uncharacterized protein Z518_08217 [Rhinocladiella mackenziei CBS 650.93]KIX02278.1 hypothetical protein Z518_08217 [Rhinocladiella mackenziei CBS 650.93]
MAPNPPAARGRSTTTRNEAIAQESANRGSHSRRHARRVSSAPQTSSDPSLKENSKPRIEKWTLGILNDKETEEVPGTVLLLSANRNEPLGLEHQHARRSSSSMPPQPLSPRRSTSAPKKRTKDGQLILDPQPDDSMNDPLNWPAWRRDCALLSLGFYCMLGGGMTPILAAGFHNVAESYHVAYSRVALTTGLYMMGLGVGSVVFSPTAILWGKRPVYLASAIMFILTSVWCALAPSYAQLATARVFQGISVSPVECLPSATIAEIFFLHERAFRVGIYTLLLLGGKNLVPLVSAAIIQAKGWRWVFWVVAIIVGFGLCILFLFVPETFWDRTPRPKSRRPAVRRSFSSLIYNPLHHTKSNLPQNPMADPAAIEAAIVKAMTPRQHMLHEQNAHARFEDAMGSGDDEKQSDRSPTPEIATQDHLEQPKSEHLSTDGTTDEKPTKPSGEETASTVDRPKSSESSPPPKGPKPTGLAVPPPPDISTYSAPWDGTIDGKQRKIPAIVMPPPPAFQNPGADSVDSDPTIPHLHSLNSPYYVELEKGCDDLDHHTDSRGQSTRSQLQNGDVPKVETPPTVHSDIHTPNDLESNRSIDETNLNPKLVRYTTNLRHSPPKSYIETLRPWNGRLSRANWFLVALRPFILFVYPSVLWSTLVYSLSVGWLIVLSEAISHIYRNSDSYHFSALGAGLVYLSPFVGGILGTAVAGKVSDIIVRFMARRNGGVYEPEFRLVMAIPVAISTAIGLMGFGWSAEEKDMWIVPTIFFGVISFGCSLGSTTSITFCVDSYRQYAGEALVTLNFSKNIFHGLVFSLFFANWLEDDGPKSTFLAIGGIQIACLLTAIPMYIYGKRGRMWTVRRGFMEQF